MISFYWWQLYNQIVMGRDIKRYWSSAMSTSVIFHHKYKLFKKMKRKKDNVFLLHSSVSYFALHHCDWKANCFWVTWWSVTISERSGSCPSITRRQNRSFSNLSMIRTESMLIVINEKKENTFTFSPPACVLCVWMNSLFV